MHASDVVLLGFSKLLFCRPSTMHNWAAELTVKVQAAPTALDQSRLPAPTQTNPPSFQERVAEI